MKELLPINKNILKWSRESIGLSLKELADKIHKPIYVIKSWEEGNSAPTYSQLEKLAYKIFKRPLAVFFFPEVPEEDSPKTEFRTLPNAIRDSLSPSMIILYRKAKVFQLNLKNLYEGEKSLKQNILESFFLNTLTLLVICLSYLGSFNRYIRISRLNFIFFDSSTSFDTILTYLCSNPFLPPQWACSIKKMVFSKGNCKSTSGTLSNFGYPTIAKFPIFLLKHAWSMEPIIRFNLC